MLYVVRYMDAEVTLNLLLASCCRGRWSILGCESAST
jgi:hypothetical protein